MIYIGSRLSLRLKNEKEKRRIKNKKKSARSLGKFSKIFIFENFKIFKIFNFENFENFKSAPAPNPRDLRNSGPGPSAEARTGAAQFRKNQKMKNFAKRNFSQKISKSKILKFFAPHSSEKSRDLRNSGPGPSAEARTGATFFVFAKNFIPEIFLQKNFRTDAETAQVSGLPLYHYPQSERNFHF